MAEKVVIVVGAGATVADAMTKAPGKRPPLDRGFFDVAVRLHGPDLRPVADYVQHHYGGDLRSPELNSLERIIAILYTDVFGGDLTAEAFGAFLQLVKVFLRRLAITTNQIPLTARCRLYRLIALSLNRGVSPGDLTIISFNQDLQVEKALAAIASTKGRQAQQIFHFPNCYRVKFHQVTAPGNVNVFASAGTEFQGNAVLKLHGSMNWYSAHNTPNPGRHSLFNPTRLISITRRKVIRPDMTLNVAPGKRTKFTFPVIVPPVVHKSGILHQSLRPLWQIAEEKLREADRVIVFGYSCPPNDWESANLIARALSANKRAIETSIIDPDPGVVLRYKGLGNLRSLNYYTSADAYLAGE